MPQAPTKRTDRTCAFPPGTSAGSHKGYDPNELGTRAPAGAGGAGRKVASRRFSSKGSFPSLISPITSFIACMTYWEPSISSGVARRIFSRGKLLTFFSVQRLHGFRQVVQHVSEHVAIGINWLIKSRKGRCCSGRKSKLVEDRYIVLCTVTLIKKTKQNTKKLSDSPAQNP